MQLRSEITRTNIMASALIVFSKSGYDGATVDEICRESGISKGAFYHHFPSKQSVFLTLLDDWLELLEKQILAIQSESASAAEALLSMSSLVGRVVEDSRGRLPLFLEFWSHASRDPAVWQATIAPYQRYQQLFSMLIEKGIQEGSIQCADPALAARLLVSLAVGILLQAAIEPQSSDWHKTAEGSILLLLKGLERKNEL